MNAPEVFLPLPGGNGLPNPNAAPRRIAIASVDIAGPYHCGGVGAAYHGLALELAAAGHDVTVVYLHHAFHQGTLEEWTAYFRDRGIEFAHLPQAPTSAVWYGNRKEASLRCYAWLARQRPFDVIHFHEWLGLPYYALLAKRQGLAFDDTLLCVETHGPMRWSRSGDGRLPVRAEDLVVDYMERKSVEMADVVISPSHYLLRWMKDDGWVLPADVFVAQHVLQRCRDSSDAGRGSAIRELVFFGRLERRKGLPFFCDVIDRLDPVADFAVTFLGSSVVVEGSRSADYIRKRAASWRTQPALLTDYSREQALDYLSQPGRLAVMPSLDENLPCAVHECIEERIPFVASDRGGIPELVHAEDRARTLLPLDADAFATRLAEVLKNGQAPARPAVDFNATRAQWRAWHSALPHGSLSRARAASGDAEAPLVSICIAHYERPLLLEQMLESVRSQTYPRVEVIVVDDGSVSSAALEYLGSLVSEFAEKNWQLLRQNNAGPGAARNRAANAARGEYLLFADDDDALFPEAAETFISVAVRTGAAALSCILMEFEGDRIPASVEHAKRPLIPLGPALAVGLICPDLGGLGMVRRDCFFAVGGFSEERDVDEDWELLLNVVAAGFNLQAIPVPLIWYRAHASTRSRSDNRFDRHWSRIRIFERMLPLELRDLASLAFSRLSSVPDAESQKRLERAIQSLEKARREQLTNSPPA